VEGTLCLSRPVWSWIGVTTIGLAICK
jgi:hypothetical protein